MTTVSIHLTPNDLLKGVQQLDGEDLEDFVQKVLHIRAKRLANSLNKEEADLIQRINASSLSSAEYDQLITFIQKSENATLSEEELKQYLLLNQKMEKLNLQRMTALAQLANIRGVSLKEVMAELGLLKKEK